MNLIQTLEAEEIARLNKTIPEFAPGDTVIVSVNVVEGTRKRVQAYEGVVIAKRNRGLNSGFIVRKISSGEGVERTFQTYSPNHTYEHTYLSSERYAWQCLVGVQRGHGDVDMASYWKFDDGIYAFTFREFLIPVASVFLFNFRDMRSTGKVLGGTGEGAVSNSPAGAFISKASMTFYPLGVEPV